MINSLKVGCHTYQIVQTPRVSRTEALKGQCNHYERIIRIDSEMRASDKLDALLHEAIHGLDEFMSLDLSEDTVSRLGSGIAMLLVDNPGLLDIEDGIAPAMRAKEVAG